MPVPRPLTHRLAAVTADLAIIPFEVVHALRTRRLARIPRSFRKSEQNTNARPGPEPERRQGNTRALHVFWKLYCRFRTEMPGFEFLECAKYKIEPTYLRQGPKRVDAPWDLAQRVDSGLDVFPSTYATERVVSLLLTTAGSRILRVTLRRYGITPVDTTTVSSFQRAC
jgi:hypothetical protein